MREEGWKSREVEEMLVADEKRDGKGARSHSIGKKNEPVCSCPVVVGNFGVTWKP
jgi:hypothetical protein